jgi:hypothetical protein
MNDFQLSEETVDDEAAVHDNAINANWFSSLEIRK